MMEIDLLEFFKTFPVCASVLIVIPVVFLAAPVNAAHEFRAFRMQHYDLHGVPYGEWKASFSNNLCCVHRIWIVESEV